MEPFEFIENFSSVTSKFGIWPSFHDGEVLRIVLERAALSSSRSPSVEISIRCWVMGPEVTGDGFYKQNNDSVVRFLFEDIFDLEIEGFNQQNVLSALNLSLIQNPPGCTALRVELEHCYLFAAEFSARKAKILGIEPYVSRDGE